MTHGFDDELTRRVEDAFDLYLQELAAGRLHDTAGFVAGQSGDLRERLSELIQQYQLLRARLDEGPRGFRAGRELGHYRLVRELGRGAMGMVFEAHDQILDRRVAVKLLYPIYTLSESVLERFRREASAGGRLSHPGIVSVIEVGEDQDTHYIVQELVRGGSLQQYLESHQRRRELTPEHFRRTAALVADIAEALGEAHAHGVVHRDIKPANVLLTEAGRPKVADFGVAWIEEEISHTGTGVTTGTPFYMSPEQADPRRGSIGPHTDVFSLGVTLYEALTLARPFEGDTRQQVAEKILAHDPLDPRKVRSRIPRDLAVICLKALEKAPADRYANGAELAADLRRFLADQSIVARPPSHLQVAWKWCLRHKALASTGAVVVVSLLVVSALSLQLRVALGANQEILDRTRPLLRALDERERADPATLLDLEAFARARLRDRPELQATWLASLGRELALAEQFERAIGALDIAWRFYASDPQRYARDGLTVGQELASTFVRAGRGEEAEALLLELLAAWPLEAGGADALALKGELLSLLLQRPQPRERLAAFRAKYGEPEELLVALQAAREEQYGARSPRALAVWLDLARFHVAEGRGQQGAEVLEAVQGRMSAYLPADHPLAYAQMDLLSQLRSSSGDHLAAVTLLRRLIATLERHDARYPAFESGELHRRLGESELRYHFLERALASFQAAAERADDPEDRAAAHLGTARTLVERAIGERTRQEELRRADFELTRALQGQDGAQRGPLLEERAFVLILARRWEEGLTACDEILAEPGSSAERHDELSQQKVLCLERLGRLDEAFALQAEIHARLTSARGPWDELRLAALRRLATLHGEHGHSAAALDAIERWRAAVREVPPVGPEAGLWLALLETYATRLRGEIDAYKAGRGRCEELRRELRSASLPAVEQSWMAEALVLSRAGVEDEPSLKEARLMLHSVEFGAGLERTALRLEAALLADDVRPRWERAKKDG